MTSKSIRKNYYQLLREPEWIEFSRRLIGERESCFECGDSENLQCHHKGYRDILPWEYDESEILVVCRACHETITTHADELWNEALRHLNTWEIYEIAKAIRHRDFAQIARLIESNGETAERRIEVLNQ